MDDLRLSLPPALAAELIREGKAGQVITWRGTDVISVLTLAADMTSAVTAVVVSRKSFAEIARRLVHHVSAKTGGGQQLSISITHAKSITVLTEDNSAVGTEKLIIQVLQALEEASEQDDSSAQSAE